MPTVVEFVSQSVCNSKSPRRCQGIRRSVRQLKTSEKGPLHSQKVNAKIQLPTLTLYQNTGKQLAHSKGPRLVILGSM